MSDPHWSQVLEYIFESENAKIPLPEISIEDESINEDHPIVTELGLSPSEGFDALEYLDEMGMIRITSEEISWFGDPPNTMAEYARMDNDKREKVNFTTTDEGFQTAQERKDIRKEHSLDLIVAAFTILLSISLFVQAWNIAYETEGIQRWGSVISLFVGIGAAFFLLRQL